MPAGDDVVAPAPPPVESEGANSASMAEVISKWIAVAVAAVGAGQAASTWISGHFDSEMARIRSKQEVDMQTLKDNSELASKYLDMVFKDGTEPNERLMIYSAMKELNGHPLQSWAAQRYDRYIAYRDELRKLSEKGAVADQIKDETERERAQLVAQLEEIGLSLRNPSVIDDEVESKRLLVEYRLKSSRLGEISAKLSVAEVQVTAVKNGKNSDLPELFSVEMEEKSANIIALSDKVTPELLLPFFAKDARVRINENIGFLKNALQEFRVSDARIAAVIVATIAVETPSYEDYQEPEANAAKYEGRVDLGNTQQGDGIRYRGRGYVGLTGRYNYDQMGKLLGLALVENPDRAADPAVAARATVALILKGEPRLSAALDAGDMKKVRNLTVGTSQALQRFSSVYGAIFAQLQNPRDFFADLKSDVETVRRSARDTLGDIGPSVVESMMSYWKENSDNYRVRLGVTMALTNMVRKSGQSQTEIASKLSDENMRFLLKAAIDPDETLRIRASELLVSLGSGAVVGPASEMFDDASPDGKYNLLAVMLASENDTEPKILALLKQEFAVWRSLPGVGQKIRSKIDELERALQ